MSDERHIDDLAEEHTLLARTLERHRSDKAREEVNAVIESRLSIHDKLDKIKEIDRRYEQTHYLSRPKELHGEIAYSSDLPESPPASMVSSLIGMPVFVSPSRESRRELYRRRARLKVVPHVARIWDTLFRQAPRIREFNRRVHLIRFGVIPIRPRLDADGLARVRQFVRDEVTLLRDALVPMIAESWIILTKFEYNLLVCLYRLTRALIECPFSPQARRGQVRLDEYAAIEQELFVLLTEDRDGSRVASALDKYSASRHTEDQADTRKLMAIVHTIIDTEQNPRGVGAFVRAINMCVSGSYLPIDSILVSGVENLIPRDYFECDSATGDAIAVYLETLIRRIPILTARLNEIARVETFSAKNRDKKEAIAVLQRFAGWDDSDENLLRRMITLHESIRRNVNGLLDGRIELSGGTTATVFDESCFDAEVNRINRIGHRLEKVSYDLPRFSLERYRRIHRGNDTGTKSEREAVTLIEDLADQMVRIATKLARFSGNRREAAGSADTVTMPYSPVCFGKAFVAPEIELLVGGDGEFAGGSILDAITRITQIGYLIGRYLEDKNVINDLREISALRAELEGIMAGIKRIASSEVATAVSSTWIVDR